MCSSHCSPLESSFIALNIITLMPLMWHEGQGGGAKHAGIMLEDSMGQKEPGPSCPFAFQVNDHIINNTVVQKAQLNARSPWARH